LLRIVAYNGHMRPQRRVMARRRMLKTGSIEFSETAIECTVRNVSEVGAALEVVSPLYIPDRFTLFIQSEQSKRTCRIVWRTGKRMGVAFH
jgi:PilZ domain-containing protein